MCGAHNEKNSAGQGVDHQRAKDAASLTIISRAKICIMPGTTLAGASGPKIDGCTNVTFCAAFSVGALRTTNSNMYSWPTNKSLFKARVSCPKDRDHPAAVPKPPLGAVPSIWLPNVALPSIALPDVALPLIPEITMVASQNIRIGATAGVR